jgi:hypothetical protein
MAVFEAHISAQVTQAMRDGLRTVLEADRHASSGASEGDVIRLAIEVGTPALHEMGPARRAMAYACLRRGLPIPS